MLQTKTIDMEQPMTKDSAAKKPERITALENISKQLDGAYTAEQIGVVQRSVAKNTTNAELAYFLNVCRTIDLNPFNKEVWCYKDNKNNLIVFTGRDGLLRKAQENPAFNGIRSCEVCENDDFRADVPNGKVQHGFSWDENRGKVVGAYAIVFRKDGEPTIEFATIKDYKPNNPSRFSPWSNKEAEMIKKCAESKALKKAVAKGIGGVQIEEDWRIDKGVATPVTVEQEKKAAPVEVRLAEYIEHAATVEELEKVRAEVEQYPNLWDAFTTKHEELKIKSDEV